LTEIPEKPLNDNWNIWFTPRGLPSEGYSKHLTLLGTVKTLKEFINYYCFLKRPAEIEDDNKIMVFREYCKPLWEVKKKKLK
jgi:translation initiation factor 4E